MSNDQKKLEEEEKKTVLELELEEEQEEKKAVLEEVEEEKKAVVMLHGPPPPPSDEEMACLRFLGDVIPPGSGNHTRNILDIIMDLTGDWGTWSEPPRCSFCGFVPRLPCEACLIAEAAAAWTPGEPH